MSRCDAKVAVNQVVNRILDHIERPICVQDYGVVLVSVAVGSAIQVADPLQLVEIGFVLVAGLGPALPDGAHWDVEHDRQIGL